MNIFIYDDFLDKYKKKLRKVEETLNELRLQGKIIYLANTKNLKESLTNELNSGAKTVIAVGNNKTVNQILNIMANFSHNIPLSIIPIGPNNSIAESLGIINGKEACYILSGRRVENINISTANNLFFIKNFFIKSQGTVITVENSYNVIPQKRGKCFVYNLASKNELDNNIKINPQDNKLNLYIETSSKSKTHLIASNLEIKNPSESGIIDDIIEIKTPVDIKPSFKNITMIVGKDRGF